MIAQGVDMEGPRRPEYGGALGAGGVRPPRMRGEGAGSGAPFAWSRFLRRILDQAGQ